MSNSAGAVDQTSARVDATAMRKFLSSLNPLVDEARIHFGEFGLKSQAVDPANVGMVSTKLASSAFDSLPESEHEFGAIIRKLEDVLPPRDGDISLTHEPERRMLGIESGPYSYSLRTIDTESIRQEPNIPTMDLPFRAELNVDLLREAVEWFDTFTTHVTVGFEPVDERLWMEADERRSVRNAGTDDGGFSLDVDELEAVHETGSAESKYSLDYFKDIVNGIPEGQTVEIYIGEEFPMFLSYEFEHGEVEYLQAPKIMSD